MKANVKKSIEWCIRYNVLYNNITFHGNSFTEHDRTENI